MLWLPSVKPTDQVSGVNVQEARINQVCHSKQRGKCAVYAFEASSFCGAFRVSIQQRCSEWVLKKTIHGYLRSLFRNISKHDMIIHVLL